MAQYPVALWDHGWLDADHADKNLIYAAVDALTPIWSAATSGRQRSSQS